MDFPFYGGSAASPTTWAARPATPFVGQRIRITDLGNKEFYWNGTVWLPMGTALLAQSGAPSSVTGTTSETALASIAIPGGMMGSNGVIRVSPLFSYTNSGNVKTLKVKFGSTAFYSTTPTTTADCQPMPVLIRNAGAANAQVGFEAGTNNAVGPGPTVTSAINTANDQVLQITGQLATAAETITLLGFIVEVLPA